MTDSVSGLTHAERGLSVVIASRNDNHGGQMIARTNTFIHALAAQARKHKIPIELILVEWNPPADKPSLLHALTWPRTGPLFCSRVIIVSRELHGRLPNSDKLRFYQMIAKNVGIRRARYPWVLATNPDLLFPDEIFQALQGGLDPAFFYRAIRVDIGLRTLDDSLSVPEQLEACRENVVRVHDKEGVSLHTAACGDFTLMAKEAWLCLQGYTEFDLWSIHIDTVFLYWATYKGYKEHLIPDAPCYHLEHDNAWVTNPEYGKGKPQMQSSTAVAQQKKMHAGTFEHNEPNWGLADEDLPDYATSDKRAVRYADLTLCAVPKTFTGHTGMIQRNAIQSWLQLDPRPHVVLIGDDPGVAEFAWEHGLEHRSDVEKTAHGTPRLDSIMAIAQQAMTQYVGLVNADIILMPDFMAAFDAICRRASSFLMIGRRTGCTVENLIQFGEGWDEELREHAQAHGGLHAAGALDYFIFRRGAYTEVPPFAIGRTAWDNWLAVNAKVALTVNATPAVMAIHQEHPDGYGPDGKQRHSWAFSGPEAKENQALGAEYRLGSTNHAGATLSSDLRLYNKRGNAEIPIRPAKKIQQIEAQGPVKTRRGGTRPIGRSAEEAPPPMMSDQDLIGRRGQPARKKAPRPMMSTSHRTSREKRKKEKKTQDSGVGGMRGI